MSKYTITVFKSLPYKGNFYLPLYEDIHTILEVIKNSCFKPQIDEIRSLYLAQDGSYVAKKLQLPVFICSGEFSSFGKNGLIRTNNLIILDFDDIPEQDMPTVYNQLTRDRYVFSLFSSPTGRGYKAIVKLENNTDDSTHLGYFNSLKAHFSSPYWDDSGKDISRACFFSSDPNLYINENSDIWTTIAPVRTHQTFLEQLNSGSINVPDEKVMAFLEGGWNKSFPMEPGKRNTNIFCRAREAAEWGVDEDYAISFFSKHIEDDFLEGELNHQVARAYQKVRVDGKFGSSRRNI